MTPARCQVAIIGAGPAGLSTAIRLRELGVDDVLVIEREATAGGIPRHCGHSPFGMREFHRLLSGPAYARRLGERALQLGVQLLPRTSVARLGTGGRLTLSTVDGQQTLQAAAVAICTGNRESPRSARLVSGTRPQGVVTTGALQSMVYLKGRQPFRRPVVVGTELVSFSALLTCRHAGIRPVAMIEANEQVTAFAQAAWLPRLLGIPLLRGCSLRAIDGKARVEAVEVEQRSGATRRIDCDGVIFSGQFVAEAALVRASHLQLDPRSGGPVVDQYGRCSDPCYFAGGNLLHPVDTAGWCWSEGRRLAACINAALAGRLPGAERTVEIACADDVIRYFTPQRIVLPQSARELLDFHAGAALLQLRFAGECRGQLRLRDGQRTICRRSLRARPETRQLLKVPLLSLLDCDSLALDLTR